jgi:hypothetical protein
MPSASGEMRPATMETTGVAATEMASSKVPAAVTTTAVTTTAMATAAMATAASCMDRARKRKRERKNNHGQEIEFRHDNLLKLPSLTWRPSLIPSASGTIGITSCHNAF